MKNIYILTLAVLFLSSCYTYNIPAGVNTPLISKEKEFKISASGNFNELGGNFAYGLTKHILFSASGNYIFNKNEYKQDYDSLFFKNTPNNFEVAFGYFGGKDKFVNMFLFGVGTGNSAYKKKQDNYIEDAYYTNQYYQANFVQYFLQYTAGFKYDKIRYDKIRHKEQGISLRYAYHNYNVEGIEEIKKNPDYTVPDLKTVSKTITENGIFKTFTVYYFYRTGNNKMQFEVSPGFSFYDKTPNYKNSTITFKNIHFNVGLVFNINSLIKN